MKLRYPSIFRSLLPYVLFQGRVNRLDLGWKLARKILVHLFPSGLAWQVRIFIPGKLVLLELPLDLCQDFVLLLNKCFKPGTVLIERYVSWLGGKIKVTFVAQEFLGNLHQVRVLLDQALLLAHQVVVYDYLPLNEGLELVSDSVGVIDGLVD